MPLHLGRSSAEMQDQTREARRFLMDHVRNDWDYPEAPHVLPFDYPTSRSTASPVASGADATAQVNAHINTQDNPTTTPLPDFEPVGWRERTYSSGDSEDEEEGTAQNYETPDAVGSTLADKKARRRRTRQERLEEEMTWNIGLAHWSAQRNAWTGAQQRATPSRPSSSRATPSRPSSSRPASSTSSANSTLAPAAASKDATTGAAPDTSLLLPLAPALLPNHPVRSRITTSTYSDIYAKIILQGRTPSIPINLQHMTRALVQGWKEEGNWPPKPNAPEASFAMRRGDGPRHPHLKKGVQAVSRVLGFGGPTVPIEAGRGQGQI